MKEGWTYKKLGEVCDVISGQSPDGKFYNTEGQGTPFYQGKKDFTLKYIGEPSMWTTDTTKIAEKDDLLMSVRAPVGDINFATQRICIGRGLAAIRTKGVVDKEYLFYFLLAIKNSIKGKEGVGFSSINRKEIMDINILYPSNLPEQRAIVARLDSAFAQIDSLKANAEKQLSEARQLFQKALEEAMTPKEGWEEKTLGEVCDIFGRIGFRGYTTKDLVNSPQDGAISLSPSNIQDGIMDYSKLTYISWFKYEESPEIKIFNGDILLVKTGSSYGKSALVENLPHEATINPQSVVLKNIKIDNKFFAYQLRTNRVREEFNQFVSGTAIPTFSQAKLSTVPVYIPTASTQNSIVAHLDDLSSHVRALEDVLKRTKDECDALKQAMLREVFE